MKDTMDIERLKSSKKFSNYENIIYSVVDHIKNNTYHILIFSKHFTF